MCFLHRSQGMLRKSCAPPLIEEPTLGDDDDDDAAQFLEQLADSVMCLTHVTLLDEQTTKAMSFTAPVMMNRLWRES